MFRQKKKKIVFFGDSITKRGTDTNGYITKLRQMLDSNNLIANYKLVAAGIDGNKINDLYGRIDNDVLSKNPYLVFIWIGVNDVWHKLEGTGTEAIQFKNTYEAVIKRLQAQNIKVILVTPAVIGEKRDNTNMQDADLDCYAEMIRRMSSQYNCGLVDIRKDFVEFENKNNRENKKSGILTLDGVHLSAEGNQLAAEKMMEVMRPILKSAIPD